MYIVTIQLSAYSSECGNVRFYGYRKKENAIKAFESYVNKYLGELGFAPLDFERLPKDMTEHELNHRTTFWYSDYEKKCERNFILNGENTFGDCFDVYLDKVEGDNVYVVCNDCTYVDSEKDAFSEFFTDKETAVSNFSKSCIQALNDFDVDDDFFKSQNKTCEMVFNEVLKEKELEITNVYDSTLYLERYNENEFGVADDTDKEFIFYEKVEYVD